MAITISDLISGLSTNYEVIFRNEYNQTVAVDRAKIEPLLMRMDLPDFQGNKISLNWLGAAPQMREWADERRAIGLGDYSYEVTIARYEATIEIDIDALRDGRQDIYTPRIREMSQNAARLEYNLISDLIANGETGDCYDGQDFFDTDHSEGDSGTQSNELTGTGSTLEQIRTDYYSAYSALMGFKDDKGVQLQPSEFRPIVWIPNSATLLERFSQLRDGNLAPSASTGGNSNVLANKFELVVDPRLSDANDWYMFRTDGAMKPFVLVTRENANYADNFDSVVPDVFDRRVGKAGVAARMVAAYGMWQKAVKVKNA